MLAGRKLLLADDSITIQKVVELTFADEGVSVVCVNNGRDAIDRLEDFSPDIVLADVFMPQMTGYEVCEYIKQNEKLKHIPVILLVGSFEPFNEAEARRVGADDTLTKPFQSIRRLMDKVGMLVSGRQPEEELTTAEYPKPNVTPQAQPERLNDKEIEITTADTQPLPLESSTATDLRVPMEANNEPVILSTGTNVDQREMEIKVTQAGNGVAERYESANDALLDLGEFDQGRSRPSEDFVLDIDLDEAPEASPVESSFPVQAFASKDRYKSATSDWKSSAPAFTRKDPATVGVDSSQGKAVSRTSSYATDDPATHSLAPNVGRAKEADSESALTESQTASEWHQGEAGTGQVSPESLPPEVIDAIARRAVEQLSERVIQEIAWEVVPPLAELMIKRQLEEKNS